METLILLIVTGALVYRLWSVLGTRTGHEKEGKDWFVGQYQNQPEQDNIIVLPARTAQTQQQDPADEEKVQELTQKEALLQKHDSSFAIEKFERGAVRAFEMIVYAYADSHLERLKSLVSSDVFERFKLAIENRNERQETLQAELKETTSRIQGIEYDKDNNTAKITIQFTSQQMMATLNADGLSDDNPSKLTVEVVDTWVFTKEMRPEIMVWTLVKTDAKAA